MKKYSLVQVCSSYYKKNKFNMRESGMIKSVQRDTLIAQYFWMEHNPVQRDRYDTYMFSE